MSGTNKTMSSKSVHPINRDEKRSSHVRERYRRQTEVDVELISLSVGN